MAPWYAQQYSIERRIEAALDARGTLVNDAAAGAFWVLADLEGNEACICMWQDRDWVSLRDGDPNPRR